MQWVIKEIERAKKETTDNIKKKKKIAKQMLKTNNIQQEIQTKNIRSDNATTEVSNGPIKWIQFKCLCFSFACSARLFTQKENEHKRKMQENKMKSEINIKVYF